MTGQGTAESPYEVTKYSDICGDCKLEEGKYYKLMNDIDCSDYDNFFLEVSGGVSESSGYAQLNLNGKKIICPVINTSSNAIRYVHIYNGYILDMYFEYMPTSSYIFSDCILDDVSFSLHISPKTYGLGKRIYNEVYFNRCNIKLMGTLSKSSFFDKNTVFTDCKINFDNFDFRISDGGMHVYANYCYIVGKIKINSTKKITTYGVLTIRGDYIGEANEIGNQNIIDVEFEQIQPNSSAFLSFYCSGSADGRVCIFNSDKYPKSGLGGGSVEATSEELLSPSALISKGLNLTEVS